MNHRRSIAVVGLAGVLALAACGTDDQSTQPADQPEVVSRDADAAFQHYYDVTHPAPKTVFSGDAKDHPRYNPSDAVVVPDIVLPPEWPGDAKDHPRYSHVAIPVSNGDAKDHPNYGSNGTGDTRLALQAPVSEDPQAFRTAFQAELASLAESEGLTGLSPAFLQRTETCSGLSPVSTSGCTTDELKAAFPGNPR